MGPAKTLAVYPTEVLKRALYPVPAPDLTLITLLNEMVDPTVTAELSISLLSDKERYTPPIKSMVIKVIKINLDIVF